MKKLFISPILAVVIIIGIFGGVVLANPPEQSPKNIWETILVKVNEILDQNNNSPMMECDEGEITAEYTGGTNTVVLATSYDQLRDVQLTISWQALDFSGQAVHVRADIGGAEREIFYGLTGEADPVGTITLDFTTDYYEIRAYNSASSTENLEIYYSVTSYWMP